MDRTRSQSNCKRKIIGYTQGTFDMYHVGHLNLLEQASARCDYLIVGVNTDDLVMSYKSKQPVVSQDDRLRVIQSVRYVDRAVLADTLDKVEMARRLSFDCIFIGDDWAGNARWAQTEKDLGPLGINVVYLRHTPGVSSTALTPYANDKIDD